VKRPEFHDLFGTNATVTQHVISGEPQKQHDSAFEEGHRG
jgi:hypothetical protein